MVSSDWEAQLTREGASGSTESQLVFQEEFALAESVAAKAQLVHRSFVPGSPDFLYYGALCELLEVQRLVEKEEHGKAWQRLTEVKTQLGMAERQLQTKSCSKRAQRILSRQLLLELDLQTKLSKPEEEIAVTTQRISTSLQVSFSDPEPAGISTEARKETYPTVLRYVDVIVKDVERKKDTYKGYSFNFRSAHRNLSFLQLLECAKRSPEIFRSNSEFAVRGMQLLQAAAEVDSAHSLDLRSEARNEKELQHIETYLEFLRDFTPTAVYGLRMKTLYRKLELLNMASWGSSGALVGLLNALVEYLKIAGGHIMSHDEILQKSLRTLWSSQLDDEVVLNTIRPRLNNDFVEIQYALVMIKLGKGEFSHWTAKLPDEGQALSSQTSSSEVIFCFLRHVERITTQGHEFAVLDERGNLLRDARALVINVKSGNKSFAVDVDIHIDSEQLVPGSVAQLATRPRLLVAGIATGESLELLVDVKLTIEFDLVNTSNVGSSSHKEVLSFSSMQSIVNHPPCFEIPMDARGFNVMRVNNFDSTYTAHLVRRSLESGNPYSSSEFRVLVLGHNGEPVPSVRALFTCKHVHSKNDIKVTLQSDAT
uniref:Uncharacterized protein n=1 Tax=Phytophthora ramorum TaxID=164328 RepID=H3HCY9_PHYRM